MELINGVAEQSWHARADRRFTAGQVITIDPIAHTCTLDVGARDVQNSPVYLHDIPFSPQTQPSVGDVITLSYANSSPHSASAASAQLGGANAQGSITVIGAVTSIAAGPLPALRGAVLLQAGSNISFSQAAQVITIDAIVPAAASTVQSVASVSSVGGLTSYAREDHTHAGVHTLAAAGRAPLTGDIVLQAGSNITLSQSGQGISIASTPTPATPATWTVIVWSPTPAATTYTIAVPTAPLLLVVNAAPAGVVVNLPPAAQVANPIAIKNYSSTTGSGIAIAPAAGETIQGNSSNWNLGSATGEMVLMPANIGGQQVWMILSLG